MITIFNGRCRGLAETPQRQVYIQVDVMFRDYLHYLRGAKLAVFMAIALHANEEGWAWPSYETLARETGYCQDKIRDALNELCALEINGRRLLLRYQPRGEEGRFKPNLYLIFPTPEEVERFEGAGVNHRPGNGFRKYCCDNTGSQENTPPNHYGKQPEEKHHNGPLRKNTTTDRCGKTPQQTRTNIELEPDRKEEEEKKKQKEKKEDAEADKIARALCEYGVFPESARRIGAAMANAGMTVDDALRIFFATIRSVARKGIPEEQLVAMTVRRLKQGIWDAGENAKRALCLALHASSELGDTGQLGKIQDTAQDTENNTVEDNLWQRALDVLRLEMTRATFETWLRHSCLIGREGDVFTIGVDNEYAQFWLENRLKRVVERVLARIVGRNISVRFVLSPPMAKARGV